MTRPAWLPPLNSHENYSINVGIHQFNYFPISTQSVPKNLKSIRIIFDVDVKFYSDNIDKKHRSPFHGLALRHGIKIQPVPPASDVKLRKWVKRILGNRELVPFKLDKIECYRETDELEPMLDLSYDNQLHSERDLVSRITDFLFCTMSQFSLTGGENLTISLMMEKSVTIPDQEFEAWTSWYEEQKKVNPDGFVEEYWAAISVPRTVHELWYESSLLAYESTAKSCIESLEKLTWEEVGDSERSSCTICLEELREGEQVTKLPCSHVFHGDCVIRWLKTSHFCPSCRFIMPSSSKN